MAATEQQNVYFHWGFTALTEHMASDYWQAWVEEGAA